MDVRGYQHAWLPFRQVTKVWQKFCITLLAFFFLPVAAVLWCRITSGSYLSLVQPVFFPTTMWFSCNAWCVASPGSSTLGSKGVEGSGEVEKQWHHPPQFQADRQTEVGPAMHSLGGTAAQGPVVWGSSSGGILEPLACSCWESFMGSLWNRYD